MTRDDYYGRVVLGNKQIASEPSPSVSEPVGDGGAPGRLASPPLTITLPPLSFDNWVPICWSWNGELHFFDGWRTPETTETAQDGVGEVEAEGPAEGEPHDTR